MPCRVLQSDPSQNKRVAEIRVLYSTLRVPVSTLENTMINNSSSEPVPMEDRLRRAPGRHARRISATAKVTRAEHAELEAASSKAGKALGEWSRETLLAAARGEVVTPTFTEVVAIRQLLNSALESIACGEAVTREKFQTQLQTIRSTKHKAAAEVMQQYAPSERTR